MEFRGHEKPPPALVRGAAVSYMNARQVIARYVRRSASHRSQREEAPLKDVETVIRARGTGEKKRGPAPCSRDWVRDLGHYTHIYIRLSSDDSPSAEYFE